MCEASLCCVLESGLNMRIIPCINVPYLRVNYIVEWNIFVRELIFNRSAGSIRLSANVMFVLLLIASFSVFVCRLLYIFDSLWRRWLLIRANTDSLLRLVCLEHAESAFVMLNVQVTLYLIIIKIKNDHSIVNTQIYIFFNILRSQWLWSFVCLCDLPFIAIYAEVTSTFFCSVFTLKRNYWKNISLGFLL